MRTMVAVLICAGLIHMALTVPVVTAETVDTRPDTWTATDGLGRTVPGYEQVGPPRPGKAVGIFYFLWLGQHRTAGPYDVTRILATQPDAMGRAERGRAVRNGDVAISGNRGESCDPRGRVR